MTIAYTAVFAVFGLVFGSFYNVVGLRVPKKQSIAYPPSHCTNCERRLTVLDLVPVFSYLFLKGQCRTCGSKIHWVYPMMEAITAVLFTVVFLKFGLTPELIVGLLFVSLLVIITVSDIAYMLIPDKVLLPFALVLLVLRLIVPLDPWWDSLVGASVGFSVLLLIAILSKGGMGGGDIKLFFVIGLVLGTAGTLLTLFFASFIGAVAGIILLRVRKQGRKTPIPFGPSIALSAVLVYLWGEQFIGWYVNLFM
ncbi:prepilin peptidase [Planococcus sp. CP5-4]|uniref:prepilin peptidase n=1 Tax=unclassified Planococcus (in: firmicutes) TaxID=2662419 RepID=UPI001C2302D6|nr:MULTISPECIES: A24 family peptidase [unclassified Planococcus (in: firmicutes)]MBU9672896.1 prepilin peptidase [Planococcus sp. CP5-4_YE]MBV0908668.1 prepilin peptidase [Planococcus sp. CP5-4_UN]MBW6063437.1 prepilin peptidase [Planococcus sp. CP5-4]